MSTFKNLVLINIITSITLIIGFVNHVAIAKFFGLTRLLDAYFSAFVIPALFMALFVNFLGRNFLPVFTEVRKQGLEQASELTSSVINVVFILSVALAILLFIFSPQIFSVILPGFSSEGVEDATMMFRIMSPAIVFMAVNTLNEYVWRYRERYIRVVLCHMIAPITMLSAIVFGSDVLAEYSLPVGLLAGHILMFLLLAIGAGYRYRFVINFKGKYIKRIFFNAGVLMTSGIIARSRMLIERYYGSTLDVGAISGISLAGKLCNPLSQRPFIGVRMITFTKSSKLFVNDRHDKVGELYNITILACLLFVVPMAVWVWFNSHEIVRVLFMRGEFNEEMHKLVSFALIGLIPSVIFRSVNPIISNAFYVMDKISVPALVMPIGIIIYIACIEVLLEKYGVFGLAMATTVKEAFTFYIMTIMLGRTLQKFSSTQVFLKLFLYIATSIVSFWLGLQMASWMVSSDILRLAISLVAGGILYASLLAVLRDRGFIYVKDYLIQHMRQR